MRKGGFGFPFLILMASVWVRLASNRLELILEFPF